MKEFSGAIEYAYIKHINIGMNQTSQNNKVFTYAVNVVIEYDLLDKDKKLIMNKAVNHVVSNHDKLYSVSDLQDILSKNLAVWVAQDKADLSGYKGA